MKWLRKRMEKKRINSAEFSCGEGEYLVLIKDQIGDTTIDRREFIARRFEYEDGVVTLINKDENFEEIFPDRDKKYEELTLKQIEQKIESSLKKLAAIKNGTDKKTNIKNVEYELFNLKARENIIKNGTDNDSFMTFDKKKNPRFTFIRKGSTYYPQAIDTDTSKVYTPSDYKKKKSAMTVRNKENKYTKLASGLLNTAMVILIIANVVFTIINGTWSYNLYTYADSQSATAKMEQRIDLVQNRCLSSMANTATNLERSSQSILKITNDLQDQMKEDTVIEGSMPIDYK